jgi:tetratricopeptide (TPR) repeat protein
LIRLPWQQALGKLDDALASYRQDLAILQRLFASNPNDNDLRSELADSRYRVGKALEAENDWQAASENYDETIRLVSTAAPAWSSRCWVRAMLGQLHEALADCNESVRLQPKVAGNLGTRGFVYLKLAQYDDAITDYNAALAIHLNGNPRVGQPPQFTIGPCSRVLRIAAWTISLLTPKRVAAAGTITFICSPLSRLTATYLAIRVWSVSGSSSSWSVGSRANRFQSTAMSVSSAKVE